MAVWTIIVMLVFSVCIGIFIFLTYKTEGENKKRQNSNVLYPFSGYLANPSPPWMPSKSPNNKGVGSEPEDGLSLLGMGGGKTATTPQIKCPVGYKINIVGAFLDIVDPYGECSNKPNSTLLATCGDSKDLSSAGSCSNDKDCGQGMKCDTQIAKCVPLSCSKDTDCGTNICKGNDHITGRSCMKCVKTTNKGGITSGKCATMPTCKNVVDGLNTICSPSSTSNDVHKCRPRDASAYLAEHCDGKSVCLGQGDVWKPNESKNNPFGPLPCKLSARSNLPGKDVFDNMYSNLPVVTGWGGGAPNKSKSKNTMAANFNQGYYVHGLFCCRPDDENMTTT